MLSKLTVGFLLLAGCAAAQIAPQAAKSAAIAGLKTATATKATVAPQTAVKSPAAMSAPKATPVTSVKPAVMRKTAPAAVTPVAKVVAVKPATAPEKLAMGENASTSSGKRDPFVSIIKTRGISTPTCAAGKKCLKIDQLTLKGVVKGPTGMLAVVENGQRKTYFLHVNDPVFDGDVIRITFDSIVFREKVVDRVGREHSREVVKRVPGAKPNA